jgi:hypothetical protein
LSPYRRRSETSSDNDFDDDNRISVSGESRGLATTTSLSVAAARKRMQNKEITMRKQVGDAESLINEEGTGGWMQQNEWVD